MSETALGQVSGGHRSLLLRSERASRRARVDAFWRAVLLLTVVVALIPLAAILGVTIYRGAGAINLGFLIENPPFSPGQEGGGYAPAIFGSIYMTGLAILMAVPLGILAAVFLVEYKRSRLAGPVRFFTDVMTGVPSVFVGLFIFSSLVVDADLFFGTVPGAAALAVLMLPIMVRSAEEVLRLVPQDLRNGAFGLGLRRWQMITRVVLPAAAPGLATGSMLAVARGMGETAPLLFTALGARQIVTSLTGTPQGALPLQVLDEGRQALPAAIERAWAGSLTLMAIVLLFTFAARFVARRGNATSLS
ncbi:MAG: phosphate ABC transporter permease PstA [Actinobacteria bacterium]|nr:phosphate ABC transporter permease PstA [Actinomycetota bacterium]